MAINKEQIRSKFVAPGLVLAIIFCLALAELSGQVRYGRHGTAAVRGEEGRAAAVGPRGAVVKGDEGYAAVGRRGAVVKGEEGAAAVGRRGAVVAGEEGYAAVGRHGGVVVGNRYEDYEAWRAVAGVSAAIAIGTMLARPPSAATTIVIAGTTYWRYQNTYYA